MNAQHLAGGVMLAALVAIFVGGLLNLAMDRVHRGRVAALGGPPSRPYSSMAAAAHAREIAALHRCKQPGHDVVVTGAQVSCRTCQYAVISLGAPSGGIVEGQLVAVHRLLPKGCREGCTWRGIRLMHHPSCADAVHHVRPGGRVVWCSGHRLVEAVDRPTGIGVVDGSRLAYTAVPELVRCTGCAEMLEGAS